MNTNEERDQFLAEQARRIGEAVEVFALARVLSGPPLGSDLVFLLVGAQALHLLPSVQEASMFGISLPSKTKPAPPVPSSFTRSELTSFGTLKPRGWWQALTAPQEVVTVTAETAKGSSQWQFQLVGGAQAFVTAWQNAWSASATP
jgi:hypothetical protein